MQSYSCHQPNWGSHCAMLQVAKIAFKMTAHTTNCTLIFSMHHHLTGAGIEHKNGLILTDILYSLSTRKRYLSYIEIGVEDKYSEWSN